VEYYAITTDPELVNYDVITDLGASWLYSLVSGMAAMEASGAGIPDMLEQFGTLSVELNVEAVPDESGVIRCSASWSSAANRFRVSSGGGAGLAGRQRATPF
jgi:hypothetical protein